MNTDPIRVRDWMTTSPITIGEEQPLVEAHQRMKAHEIRHLPVLRRGQLVGVVTERDLALCEAMETVDTSRVPVEEAMAPDPWSVRPEAPLEEVVTEMIRHKFGCAVVVDGGHVIGVLTTIDALAALRHMLVSGGPVPM